MIRTPSKTFTLVLAGLLTLAWSSEGEARCRLLRRRCRPQPQPQATYCAPAPAPTVECICPYMRYATYPDHEQWTAKNCSTGAQFTRDYPLHTYMGMCPGPMWPNCNSPCQPVGAFRGPGHKSNQTQKRYETDEPNLREPWAFLGEPKPHIRKLAADNYSFDDPDDPTKTYYVRVLTHKLPRGWYDAGRGRPRVPLYADTTLTYGIQIFQPKKSTKIMTVASEGDGIFVLTIGTDDVRVITTGTP